MTPHNIAKFGEIAKIVLMPGDPLRAKWIAENFLENYKLVNTIRSMYCYTGTYKGKEVSVMGHGMGIPSIGIYSYELFKFYDVDVIIRIGSTGSYSKEFNVNDLFLVTEAYSESTYATTLGIDVISTKNCLFPSKEINEFIINEAKNQNISLKLGRCHSSDVFYGTMTLDEIVNKTKAQCVEMEAFGLFANALLLNKKAATILTCSDSLVTGESLDAKLRQTSFKKMVLLTLDAIVKM